jgi:hypothetical protein
VYVESTGLFLAGCAAEGIDSGTDGDVGEARVLKHFLPARTGQPTGYSSGPQVDVLQRFGGDGVAVGDVSELKRAARAQYPVDRGEDGALVRA